MLAYREFLEAGVPFGFGLPSATDNAAIWSGLRLDDRALVRAFTLGEKPVAAKMQPWADAAAVKISAPRVGKTYLLKRAGAGGQVEVSSAP